MLRIKVTIRDNDYPSRFIEMKMKDYIDFIKEQATLLGITKKKEQPIYLVGFDEGSTLYCEKKEENK